MRRTLPIVFAMLMIAPGLCAAVTSSAAGAELHKLCKLAQRYASKREIDEALLEQFLRAGIKIKLKSTEVAFAWSAYSNAAPGFRYEFLEKAAKKVGQTNWSCPALKNFSDFPIASKTMVCKGDRSKWITSREKSIEKDEFYKYAKTLFGPALKCEGKLTDKNEGSDFRKLSFFFIDGAIVTIETSPPETSELRLDIPKGFKDEKAALERLKEITKKKGFNVDWSKPDVAKEGQAERKTFWDPAEGMNGRGFLVYKAGKLVTIGYGAAL